MATLPLAAPTRHLISVDAFHRMGDAGILGPEDRVELIDGEIIDMSPIGALHAAIVDVLARQFGRHAGENVPLYARHGIPEAWVIEAATRRTRVFRRPAGGRYRGRWRSCSSSRLSGAQ